MYLSFDFMFSNVINYIPGYVNDFKPIIKIKLFVPNLLILPTY